jgi:hypothetical protein
MPSWFEEGGLNLKMASHLKKRDDFGIAGQFLLQAPVLPIF